MAELAADIVMVEPVAVPALDLAPHPGEVLTRDYLTPLKITPYQLAKALGVGQQRVYDILAGRRAITADTALRLGVYFGTAAEKWLELQVVHDLAGARAAEGEIIARVVRPFLRARVR